MFRLKRSQIVRRGVVLLLGCCALLPLAGCIILPLPEHGLSWGKGRIDDSDLEFVKAGVTTREDLLLNLGEPEVVLSDGDVFVYSWGVTSGFFLVLYAGRYITKHHSFSFEFSPDNRLLRMQKYTKWGQGIQSAFAKLYSTYETDHDKLVVVMDPLPDIWTRTRSPGGTISSLSISVGQFRDDRTEPYSRTMFGRSWDKFLFKETEVHANRPISEIVRACVVHQLERSGYSVVERDAAVVLDGFVMSFEAEVTTVRLDVSLRLRSASDQIQLTRRFRISSKDWSSIFSNRFTERGVRAAEYSTFSLERTVRSVLEDFQEQVASDPELNRFLTRN